MTLQDMHKKITYLAIAVVCSALCFSQQKLTILFAGDAMQHIPQTRAAACDSNHYDYSVCFRYILPYIEQSNYSVVNFETTLSGKPFTGFPRFSGPDEWYYALKAAGFRYFALANNHILDKDTAGLRRTTEVMGEGTYMGAYMNRADRDEHYPIIINYSDVKVALFNYTYGTNGIKAKGEAVVNYIDTAIIRKDIETTANQNIDVRIAFMHWGNEYQTHANRHQTQLAHWLRQIGFDVVIGSHPHVVQNAQWLSDDTTISPMPVVYSLGNFFSNQRKTNTNGGIMAEVEIDLKTKQVTAVRYLPFYIYRGVINGRYQYYAIPTTDYLAGRLSVKLPPYAEAELRLFHKNTTERLEGLPLLTLRPTQPLHDFIHRHELPHPAPLPQHLHKTF